MNRLLGLVLFMVLAIDVAWAQGACSTEGEDPEPRDIEHCLRTVGRVVGQPDSALSLLDRMRYWNVPGVSIAIIDGFEVAYAEGFGVAEFGGSTAVDTSTLFQAASLSKPVSTSGILQLVERGDLRLDEDVNAALTSWRLPESRFTEARNAAGLAGPGFCASSEHASARPPAPKTRAGARVAVCGLRRAPPPDPEMPYTVPHAVDAPTT